jgi:hypothetical protein
MSSQYAGDPNAFPIDFTIPDDADPPTAAAVNVGLEALGDRTAWLRERLVVLECIECLTDDTLTAPEGAEAALIEGCGGGGGAGGGMNFQSADTHASGGGGGGGAQRGQRIVPIIPGDDYEVTIGSGGAGGAAEADGAHGGFTRFMHVLTSTALAIFVGGEAGLQGQASANGPTGYTWGLGGRPSFFFSGLTPASMDVSDLPDLYRQSAPGQGGSGVTGNNSTYRQGGMASIQAIGGASGTCNATSSGSYRGGGAGGGGGAGAYGNGGAGGNGGTPNNAGASSGGTAGADAGANSGGGGGGGGSSGGSTTAGTGGAGGDGGSGRCYVTWLKRGEV